MTTHLTQATIAATTTPERSHVLSDDRFNLKAAVEQPREPRAGLGRLETGRGAPGPLSL